MLKTKTLITGILVIGIIVGVIFISSYIQKSSKEQGTTGEALEAYGGFNLELGEIKEFSVSEHEISVTYLGDSPNQELEVVVDGEREVITIEKSECLETKCLTCFKYKAGTECRSEPSFCLFVDNECKDIAKEKKPEVTYTCEKKEEKTDCRYSWEKGEIILDVNPLIIEQDLDKDGKICEDPYEINGESKCGSSFKEGPQKDNDNDGLVNEDYQEKYYFRNSWETELLEFSIYVSRRCPPGRVCPDEAATQ